MNRDFKGIWIPRHIWLDANLSIQAKCLWAEIDSLFSPEKGGCHASDEYLANFLSLGLSRFKEVLKELRDAGLIENVSFNGRERIMKAIAGEPGSEQLAGFPASYQPENRPSHSRNPGFCPYIEKKEEKKEESPKKQINQSEKPTTAKSTKLSELPFGRVASFFYEKISSINPKVKKPNLEKWAKELSLLSRDGSGSSEEDILKVIEFVTESQPKNGFCWANVVQCPTSLRKHFAKLWGEMNQSKKPQNDLQSNEKLAKAISSRFKRDDILLGHNYLEFINGQYANHLNFDDKDFKSKCMNELDKRKLRLEA